MRDVVFLRIIVILFFLVLVVGVFDIFLFLRKPDGGALLSDQGKCFENCDSSYRIPVSWEALNKNFFVDVIDDSGDHFTFVQGLIVSLVKESNKVTLELNNIEGISGKIVIDFVDSDKCEYCEYQFSNGSYKRESMKFAEFLDNLDIGDKLFVSGVYLLGGDVYRAEKICIVPMFDFIELK